MTPQEILEQPTWDDVLRVLRSDKLRSYRVDIETDSTVEPDATEEKQASIEFMSGATQFFTGAGPIIQAAPETTGMFLSMFKSAARRFKPGRELEDKIDEAATALESRAKQMLDQAQQGPPPDPRAEEIKMKMELEKAKLQNDTQRMQFEMQMAERQAQQDAVLAQQKAQTDAQAKAQAAATQAATELQKAEMNAEVELEKAGIAAETEITKAQIAGRVDERKAALSGGESSGDG